jgi:ureidoglycolate lyase
VPRLELKLEPLTAEAFAPFGDVIEVSPRNNIMPINYGNTERHHDLAKVDVNDAGGRAIISVFRSLPTELPFQVRIMERHPLGSQAFMPLTDNPYLVLVAPAGELDPWQIRAFIAASSQGVNYHKGTWHHYSLGLNDSNDYLVIDRDGAGHNCDEVELPRDLELLVNH